MPHFVVSGNLALIAAPLGRLGGAHVQFERALAAGGDKVRTKVRHTLKEQTNVKRYGAVVDRTPSYRRGLEYVIEGVGKGLPIEEFPVGVVSGGVQAEPWGVAHLFKRSFHNAIGYRARLGPKRFPIRKLYGPSIAKEIVKDKVPDVFEAAVVADVVPAIDAVLAALA